MSDLLFEYKVRARHKLGWKEFSFYAATEIEEFLNRNNIEYVRNMTDTVENRLFKEIESLNHKLEIANNKLNMIKDNAQILTPDKLLEIIENYTGFFGKECD